MKAIEYLFLDKSEWGAGPWQIEPDKVQWQDNETGLPCLVRSFTFDTLSYHAESFELEMTQR
jgi:hypothetical protein